jgi:peptidoglycan biosynthesis protein MviN/MurJ (putative lipid II flippase)
VARHLIFLTLPIATLFSVLSTKIVYVILGTGLFDASDILLVGACLSIFAWSIVPQNMNALFVRMFYAEGKTKKPLFLNITSAVFTIVFGFIGVYFLSKNISVLHFVKNVFGFDFHIFSILTLVLSYTVGSFINMILLWIFIEKGFRGFSKPVFVTMWKSVGASIVLGLTVRLLIPVYESIFFIKNTFAVLIEGVVLGFIGFIVALLFLVLFKNEEVWEMFKVFKRRFVK